MILNFEPVLRGKGGIAAPFPANTGACLQALTLTYVSEISVIVKYRYHRSKLKFPAPSIHSIDRSFFRNCVQHFVQLHQPIMSDDDDFMQDSDQEQ